MLFLRIIVAMKRTFPAYLHGKMLVIITYREPDTHAATAVFVLKRITLTTLVLFLQIRYFVILIIAPRITAVYYTNCLVTLTSYKAYSSIASIFNVGVGLLGLP